MDKHYISLKTRKSNKQIFMISYTKDGGIFIKDLIRLNNDKKTCQISKSKTDVNNHGIRNVKPHYSAITSGEAKLTHHFDGNAHISGTNIISGYDENGNPKGAAIKSFPLNYNNDGGTVFQFLSWGIEFSCRDSKTNDFILIPDDNYIHSSFKDEILNGFLIKGYYLLKNLKKKDFKIPKNVLFNSPIDGQVKLDIIPSPPNTPGVIGVLATKTHHGFKNKFGFALSGAPSMIYDNHYCDQLNIIYPFEDKKGDHKNLDYISHCT